MARISKDSVVISVYLPKEVAAQLRVKADRDQDKLSTYIRKLLVKEGLRKHQRQGIGIDTIIKPPDKDILGNGSTRGKSPRRVRE
jgi:hypothetical protein